MRSDGDRGYIRFRHGNIKIFKWQVPGILLNMLISAIFGFIGCAGFIKIYFNDNWYLHNVYSINDSYDYGVTNVINKLNQSIVGVSAYIKNREGNLVKNNMTGVLYSEDGYIVTNSFGLLNAEKIYIKIPTTLDVIKEAKIVGYNEDYDICLLKIDGNGYVKGRFKENVSGITYGLRLISISNVMGNLNSYSIFCGLVNGFGIIDNNIKIIKSDINVNSYNTGGPISDVNGEIIGMSSVSINDKFNSCKEGSCILISSQDIVELVDEIIMSAT